MATQNKCFLSISKKQINKTSAKSNLHLKKKIKKKRDVHYIYLHSKFGSNTGKGVSRIFDSHENWKHD